MRHHDFNRKWNKVRRLLRSGDLHLALVILTRHLPAWLCRYERYSILRLDLESDGRASRRLSQVLREFRRRSQLTIRQAQDSDLDHLEHLVDDRGEFRQRSRHRDVCFVAEAKGTLVGRLSSTFRPYPVGEYLVEPGTGGAIYYNAYTHPDWRFRGIHGYLLQAAVDHFIASNKTVAYTHIDYDNEFSLRTHLRFGFRTVQTLTTLTICGLQWLIREDPTSGERKTRFRLKRKKNPPETVHPDIQLRNAECGMRNAE